MNTAELVAALRAGSVIVVKFPHASKPDLAFTDATETSATMHYAQFKRGPRVAPMVVSLAQVATIIEGRQNAGYNVTVQA